MAWDSTLPIMIRSAIGDTGDPPKYSDDGLAPIILTAASFVMFSLRAPAIYVYDVDVENGTIDPDPMDDANFAYLLTLKSAAMLLMAEVRRYGQQAIAIRDGTSAIDLKRDLRTLKDLADSYAKELENAVFVTVQGMGTKGGRAVLSPYKGLINRLDGYMCDNRVWR